MLILVGFAATVLDAEVFVVLLDVVVFAVVDENETAVDDVAGFDVVVAVVLEVLVPHAVNTGSAIITTTNKARNNFFIIFPPQNFL